MNRCAWSRRAGQLVVAGVLLAVSEAPARELLRYEFAGASPVATHQAAGIAGSDVQWIGLEGGYCPVQQDAVVAGSELMAMRDRRKYLAVTIQSEPGTLMNLESVSFQLGGSRVGSGPPAWVAVSLRSDADLEATAIELAPGPVWRAVNPVGTADPSYTTWTADLSHSIYQSRRSLTLRIYPEAGVDPATVLLRLDSLVFRGDVITEGLRIHEHDICVYGGTSGGVVAAVQAARMGKRVGLLAFGLHLGGMSSGGLGMTDRGSVQTIGGLAREVYARIGAHYGGGIRYEFEPSVAEAVFNEMAEEAGVAVYHGQRIAAVVMEGTRIREIHLDDGSVHRAAMFIDASYEGDLMALAGVTYTYGREANSQYGETLNGVRVAGGPSGTQIDPYWTPGDPESGLIPNVQSHVPGPSGSADALVQAYNFRMCLTQAPDRIPFGRPPGYDPDPYELLARFMALRSPPLSLITFMTLSQVGNGKTDTNNRGGAISTDLPAASWPYPEAGHRARREIWYQHEDFMRGFFYFLGSNERVPAEVRLEMQSWGMAADEFVNNDGWPHQLYVREARRMVSGYVITQADVQGNRIAPDSIAMGSYPTDSHTVARVVVDGYVRVDGGMYTKVSPYPIAYRAIIPRVEECENLLVTFALSATHVAFGSLRMEPVLMMTSHAAATAACLAIDAGVSLQELDYSLLAAQLQAEGQVLGLASADPFTVENSDTARVTVTGAWAVGGSSGYSGTNYHHDQNTGKGEKSFRFRPELAEAGPYEVSAWWVAHSNRATAVPVDIEHAQGTTTVMVNQRQQGSQWVPLGTFDFVAGTDGSVRIRTTATNGYVIADAVRFRPVDSTGVVVELWATRAVAAEPARPDAPARPGSFTVWRRGGDLAEPLAVQVGYGGSAIAGSDYIPLAPTVMVPAQQAVVTVPVVPLADAEVEGDEWMDVHLLPSPGIYDLGNLRTARISLADSPVQAWLARHFTAAERADAAISSLEADPDGDGLINLAEAFAGTDPWVPNAIPSPLGTAAVVEHAGGRHLALELLRACNSPVGWRAETSTDLRTGTWQADGSAIEETVLEDDGMRQRIRLRDRAPLDDHDQRFLRVRLGGGP